MSVLRDAIVQHLQDDANVTALATGGVFPGLPAEADQQFPFISVTAQKAPSANWVFQQVGFEDAMFLVKAVDQSTSCAAVAEINEAIRTSLNLANLTITGYTNMGILWMQDVAYDENISGQTFQHEGGLYSLMAHQ